MLDNSCVQSYRKVIGCTTVASRILFQGNTETLSLHKDLVQTRIEKGWVNCHHGCFYPTKTYEKQKMQHRIWTAKKFWAARLWYLSLYSIVHLLVPLLLPSLLAFAKVKVKTGLCKPLPEANLTSNRRADMLISRRFIVHLLIHHPMHLLTCMVTYQYNGRSILLPTPYMCDRMWIEFVPK